MPVLSGERWAANGPTTTITWSFATVNWGVLRSEFNGYRDFHSYINADYRATIEAAFAAWEAVANIDLVLVPDSAEVNIRVGNITIDGRPPSGGSSTLATAWSWWTNSYYQASQIYFDVDAYDNGRLYQVAVHEIGHALGLSHSSLATSVMYASNNPQNASGVLSSDDISGIVSIYGARGTTTRDDYAGATSTSGTVTVGRSATGLLETIGDSDWFRVSLVAGRSYRLDVEGRDSRQGTLIDPVLEVRGSTGAVLGTFDDGGVGANSRGTFTATTTGTHYLSVGSDPVASVRTGTYRVLVADVTAPSAPNVFTAETHILRGTGPIAVDIVTRISAGTLTFAAGVAELIKAAGGTTSVATLAYQFFTGKIPSLGGMDYLVAVAGANPNNLNSVYYQSFNVENRYINFAVNLGKEGEGKVQFAASYGGLTLHQATAKAYQEIFGQAPSEAKVASLLAGGRDLYFDSYGRDGLNGIGTKAAMVGWLLAEAQKADVGMYARANTAFLQDLVDGASFAVSLVGVYGKAEFNFGNG